MQAVSRLAVGLFFLFVVIAVHLNKKPQSVFSPPLHLESKFIILFQSPHPLPSHLYHI